MYHLWAWCPQKSKEGIRSAGTQVNRWLWSNSKYSWPWGHLSRLPSALSHQTSKQWKSCLNGEEGEARRDKATLTRACSLQGGCCEGIQLSTSGANVSRSGWVSLKVVCDSILKKIGMLRECQRSVFVCFVYILGLFFGSISLCSPGQPWTMVLSVFLKF